MGGAVVKWSSKLFDDRTALSDLYAFDGEKGGDAWRTRVRGYFIGCCPEMADWLDWAEGVLGKLPKRSDDQTLTLEETVERGTSMGEESGVILSMHVWEFLQICCRGAANTTFLAVKPELNGLEVWRALVWEINSGRSTRMLTLREEVHRPTPVKDYRLVSTAISRYDVTIASFVAAGGTRPSEDELKQNFLKSLPQDLREALLLKATEETTYDVFKNHIRTKVAFILHCRGGTAAHHLENEPLNDLNELRENIGDDAFEEILAIARGRPGQRSGPGRRSPAPARTSPGTPSSSNMSSRAPGPQGGEGDPLWQLWQKGAPHAGVPTATCGSSEAVVLPLPQTRAPVTTVQGAQRHRREERRERRAARLHALPGR